MWLDFICVDLFQTMNIYLEGSISETLSSCKQILYDSFVIDGFGKMGIDYDSMGIKCTQRNCNGGKDTPNGHCITLLFIYMHIELYVESLSTSYLKPSGTILFFLPTNMF